MRYVLSMDKERLDQIFFKYHNNKKLFNNFLLKNPNLLQYVLLPVNQKVFLLEDEDPIEIEDDFTIHPSLNL